MQILQLQIFDNIEGKSTFLQEDSHVKTQALQTQAAEESGLMDQRQDCGDTWLGQFMNADLDSLLPKTWQTSLRSTEGEILESFSIVWPQWGIMQSGRCCTLQTSVRRTTEQGCTWLLTPKASDQMRDSLSFPMWKKRLNRSCGCLNEQLYRLEGAVSGRVNHQFYAWMMGFPENWLDKRFTDMEMQ